MADAQVHVGLEHPADAGATLHATQPGPRARPAGELDGPPESGPLLTGVYVYAYRESLHPALVAAQGGKARMKIGQSRASAMPRSNRQTRVPTQHDDVALLRVYLTEPERAAEMERKFHHALAEFVGHERANGSITGREWFITDLRTLDTIAWLLGLRIGVLYFKDAPTSEIDGSAVGEDGLVFSGSIRDEPVIPIAGRSITSIESIE